MVIRDLTLRSAASFGSFHLIRLLYDEYMFYLVEHRVAQATGETPIGVMGEVISFFLFFFLNPCTTFFFFPSCETFFFFFYVRLNSILV